MKCFELTDLGVVEGFRIEPDAEPHINVTSDGALYLPIDPNLAPIIHRAASARPSSVQRLRCAMVALEKDYITSCSPSDEAFVRIDVSAGQRGKVTLSSANDRGETMRGRRVTKSFGPFPPAGMGVLSPSSPLPYDKRNWHIGAQRLELIAVMMPGASFRIHRTVPPRKVPPTSYVLWTGRRLEMTGRTIERTEEVEAHL